MQASAARGHCRDLFAGIIFLMLPDKDIELIDYSIRSVDNGQWLNKPYFSRSNKRRSYEKASRLPLFDIHPDRPGIGPGQDPRLWKECGRGKVLSSPRHRYLLRDLWRRPAPVNDPWQWGQHGSLFREYPLFLPALPGHRDG